MQLFLRTIDPLGQTTVMADSDHCFRRCCPSLHPPFQNLAKQNKFQTKIMFTTDETACLAEWIIDDTCLVYTYVLITSLLSSFHSKSRQYHYNTQKQRLQMPSGCRY